MNDWSEILGRDFTFLGDIPKSEIAEKIADAWDEEKQDEGEGSNADILTKEIFKVGLRMGLLARAEDFLIENNAPQKVIDEYIESRYKFFAISAAKQLNIRDYRPLMVRATRTKEQEKAITEIAFKDSVMRAKLYLESNYYDVFLTLAETMGKLSNVDESNMMDMMALESEEDKDKVSTISFLTRYFFVLHGSLRAPGVDEIDPAERNTITEEQKAEVVSLMQRLCEYKQRHNVGYYESIAPCFNLGGAVAAQVEFKQTEISQSRYFYMPTSLLWQRQKEIATLGPRGGAYDVSKRGTSNPVLVTAKVTDRYGNQIDINGIRKAVQSAIGNLIDQAREDGSTELTEFGFLNPPIEITPDQVYRMMAGLGSSDYVTDQQAAEIESAIDSLTSAPSQIRFENQLEQHKHIKKQPDYDYDSPNAGGLEENLIMARKIWVVSRNGKRGTGYQILSYPLFYRYSHIIGQMAKVKRELITSGEKPAIKESKVAGAQNNSRDVLMRHNVLTRIERMKKDDRISRKILLSEVAEDEGFILTEKTERTLRKNMEQYLTGLRAKKEIKGFSPVKGGCGNRKFVGFSLTL